MTRGSVAAQVIDDFINRESAAVLYNYYHTQLTDAADSLDEATWPPKLIRPGHECTIPAKVLASKIKDMLMVRKGLVIDDKVALERARNIANAFIGCTIK